MSGQETSPKYSLTEIGDVLLVAPHSAIHDSALVEMVDDLLEKLQEGKFDGLILDVSGVDMVDSFMMRAMGDLTNSARFLGVETVISGMRPEIAITLVELGFSFPGIPTALNLEEAMKILQDDPS